MASLLPYCFAWDVIRDPRVLLQSGGEVEPLTNEVFIIMLLHGSTTVDLKVSVVEGGKDVGVGPRQSMALSGEDLAFGFPFQSRLRYHRPPVAITGSFPNNYRHSPEF